MTSPTKKTKSEISGRLYSSGKPVSIRVADGWIEDVVALDGQPSELENVFVAPGLIDIQVNGFKGIDFSAEDLTVEDVRQVTRDLWREGVTTYLPTLISAPRERLRRNLSVLAEAMQTPEVASSVPGFHLEGPYLSPENGARGAHSRAWVRKPDWREFTELQQAAGDGILLVTLAPDLDGAIEFIKKCVQSGVLVALGHHNASAETIKQAVAAGAVLSTHIGNACHNMIHRHHNPLWPQLADDRLMASMIVDGFHLSPDEVKVFFRAKGPGRLVLVSDVTWLAGLPAGEYTWHGQRLVMSEAGRITSPAQNVLAGASLPLRLGLINTMRYTNCSLSEAWAMVSGNPSKLFGWTDRGEIKAGMRADLLVFKYDLEELSILKTIVAGNTVYEAC